MMKSVGMQISSLRADDLLIVSEKGMGKRTSIERIHETEPRRKRREMLQDH